MRVQKIKMCCTDVRRGCFDLRVLANLYSACFSGVSCLCQWPGCLSHNQALQYQWLWKCGSLHHRPCTGNAHASYKLIRVGISLVCSFWHISYIYFWHVQHLFREYMKTMRSQTTLWLGFGWKTMATQSLDGITSTMAEMWEFLHLTMAW